MNCPLFWMRSLRGCPLTVLSPKNGAAKADADCESSTSIAATASPWCKKGGVRLSGCAGTFYLSHSAQALRAAAAIHHVEARARAR